MSILHRLLSSINSLHQKIRKRNTVTQTHFSAIEQTKEEEEEEEEEEYVNSYPLDILAIVQFLWP